VLAKTLNGKVAFKLLGLVWGAGMDSYVFAVAGEMSFLLEVPCDHFGNELIGERNLFLLDRDRVLCACACARACACVCVTKHGNCFHLQTSITAC
jgi:hypothetical protein